MVNVGYVIIFIQFVQNFINFCSLFRGLFFRIGRDTGEFSADDIVFFFFQVFLDISVSIERALEIDYSIFVFEDFIYLVVDYYQFEFIRIEIFRFIDFEYTLPVEHKVE